MFKRIRVFFGCVLLLPHIIVFSLMKIKSGGERFLEDLHRWKSIKNLIAKSDLWAFIYLLMVYPELRSVFYWRLGKMAKFIFFWMPGRTNLYLMTSSKNAEGGFYVGHGWGTVVNAQRIGKNFRVGQNVTIGSRNVKEPIIGDNVSVWANAVVLGDIHIGDNSQVGAGSIVVKSVPENSVVVPSKSVIIKQNGERVNVPL